ncbi:hypothetical protein GALL_304030 [mine drainage metagenome]|uniref:Uncharacterized protein n=1 Tax=mine drainage metagenome TaxID=410659 RepID=A0A1J5RHZ4_9ZZZZ
MLVEPNPSARPLESYPYCFHIALDGNGINGLEGMAGVCLFLYEPSDGAYAYKLQFYDGVAGGHAVSVNPAGRIGFLGNTGQHLLLYDARTLVEIGRVSTLRYDTPDTSLQGSTHIVWTSDTEFITAIGKSFYRFSVDRLEHAERLVDHRVKLPHAMKLTASGRYLVYGSMDNPADGARGEARHVGILDLHSMEVRVVPLPATCWHLVVHASEDLFYAVSFRVMPQDHVDWHEWAMAYLKEYAFEIDAATATVRRHWSAGREIPAHINSDICLSDTELIFCNGASQTIMCIDLASFASYRFIDEKPDLQAHFDRPREVATQVFDILARGNVFTSNRHILGALRVSRFSLLDSVYACQLSSDQRLLFTANRGLNHISIYDYPSTTLRLRVKMPAIQEHFPWMSEMADPRLGFHHGYLLG